MSSSAIRMNEIATEMQSIALAIFLTPKQRTHDLPSGRWSSSLVQIIRTTQSKPLIDEALQLTEAAAVAVISEFFPSLKSLVGADLVI